MVIRSIFPASLLVGIFVYIYFGLGRYLIHFCLFDGIFNFYCPLCKTTLSLEFLFQGDLISSIKTSIVGICILLYFIFYQIFLFFGELKKICILDKVFFYLVLINYIYLLWQ
ncbi:MAG: DUF2752 domain-containing protein [Pelagibacterales bacterium]|nr:DUF2752 domain-containing protein [Pelagibacterales bacterium]